MNMDESVRGGLDVEVGRVPGAGEKAIKGFSSSAAMAMELSSFDDSRGDTAGGSHQQCSWVLWSRDALSGSSVGRGRDQRSVFFRSGGWRMVNGAWRWGWMWAGIETDGTIVAKNCNLFAVGGRGIPP